MKRLYKIGCVGLLSDLPIFVAHAKRFFLEEGESVELNTELGWAGIEAKLSSGQLDAANVPGLMPLALSLGLSKVALPMRGLVATSYEANAITLQTELIHAIGRNDFAHPGSIKIGIETPYSHANLLLQTWLLRSPGALRARVSLVPLAISQLLDFFKEGSVQGICASEPIGEIATEAGLGSTIARSRDYFPFHLQSILAARASFYIAEEAAVSALSLAVKRARSFCADPANHAEVVQIFSQYKSSALASSPLPRSITASAAQLHRVIAFEAREGTGLGRGNDPFGTLVSACAALPGLARSEEEIRRESKRVFSALCEEAAPDLRVP